MICILGNKPEATLFQFGTPLIQETKTMKKDRYYDNTRVSSFRECPRKFFYRHVQHWVPDTTGAPLVFGSSWHEAMDVVWQRLSSGSNLDTNELAIEALRAFIDHWVSEGLPSLDEMGPEEIDRLGFRNPATAHEMLIHYIDERRSLLEGSEFELISFEEPFAVPLDPEDDSLLYVGRLDKVFKLKGRHYVGEHKTTAWYKKDGGFRYEFLDSFSPNSQIDGYLFAARMLYGKSLKGVWIDAALVHKTVHDAFKIIPIERLTAQLDSWLWETKYWIQQIDANKEADLSGDYMAAYPKNTQACSNYGGCPYLDLCKMWSNPSEKETPQGFRYDPWDPFDKLQLEKLGLEPPKEGRQ
jgi:hypothetical protein